MFRDGWEGLTWSTIILINDELTFEVFTALHMQEIGMEAILLHFRVRRHIPERRFLPNTLAMMRRLGLLSSSTTRHPPLVC
jgi:hypothetical protein